MDIGELEKAVRTLVARDPMKPLLAGLAGGGQMGVQLPEEFRAAARTLASRSAKPSTPGSLLRTVAEAWF